MSKKQQPPFDPNYGLNPEEVPHDWEYGRGPTVQSRVTSLGRNNQEFLKKVRGESSSLRCVYSLLTLSLARSLSYLKMNSTSDGASSAGDRVMSLGREKMELVSGGVVDSDLKKKNLRQDSESESESESDDSDDSDSDDPADKSTDLNDADIKQGDDDNATLTTEQISEKKRLMEKEADSLKLLDNDWDTSGWTLPEIESATSTLISEIETGGSVKRRELSLKMVGRLLDRHKEAVNYINKVSESILNKALPMNLTNGIHPHALNLSHLLAFIGHRFADEFSVLGPISKICKILTYEMDLATRVLQWRYEHRVERARVVRTGANDGNEKHRVA